MLSGSFKRHKWKKDISKKIRFSFSARISLNYLRFLVINGMLFFAILALLFFNAEMREQRQIANQMIVYLETDTQLFEHYVSEVKPKGISILLMLREEQGEERDKEQDTEQSKEQSAEQETEQDLTQISLYSGETEMSAYSFWFNYLHLSRDKGEWKLYLKERETIFLNQREQKAYVYYDMSEVMKKLTVFLLQAGLAYIILMIFVLIECRQDNIKIFRPVRELTQTVRKLTVNNLHSERLSMPGTTTELRDLAEVFNEMLDRLEMSYKSQKQFVSNASHELRTPIAVIQGYIGMLARWGTQDPEILQESIEAVKDEAKAMQELVEKLLFLSRHDMKTMNLQKQVFSMGEVVEEMVRETRMVIKERKIEARLIQNVKVYGDPQSLKQAVRVFIDNAIKYSNPGDTITIACEDRYGDCILTVADTGIGMKKEDANHMFDRFFRSDDVRNKKIEGHGLGLSIARLIILAHAGTIKVRTQYTKGTGITILLPKQRKLPREMREDGEAS